MWSAFWLDRPKADGPLSARYCRSAKLPLAPCAAALRLLFDRKSASAPRPGRRIGHVTRVYRQPSFRRRPGSQRDMDAALFTPWDPGLRRDDGWARASARAAVTSAALPR